MYSPLSASIYYECIFGGKRIEPVIFIQVLVEGMSDVDGVEVTYPRVRKTLRNRRYQQSGGAYSFTTIKPERVRFWNEHCDALRKDTDLGFILTDTVRTLELREYIKIVGNQDKLFNYALLAMYDMLGIKEEINEETIIKKFNENRDKGDGNVTHKVLTQFIVDICGLINGVSSEPLRTANTKFNYLIKQNPIKQLQMLVNPALFSNLFVSDLARICVEINKNKNILGATPEIQEMWESRFNAIIEANARALTSFSSMDGFFISQDKTIFRGIMGFSDKPLFFINLFKFINDLRLEQNVRATNPREQLAYITSLIIIAINNDTKQIILDTVIEMIKDKFPGSKKLSTIESQLAVQFNIEDVFKRISLEEYQFVIHLCAVINKLATEEAPPSA